MVEIEIDAVLWRALLVVCGSAELAWLRLGQVVESRRLENEA